MNVLRRMPHSHVIDLLHMLKRADRSAIEHAYPDRMVRISRTCLDALAEALEELRSFKRPPRPRLRWCRYCGGKAGLTITTRGRAYHKRCNAAYQREYMTRRRSA